MPHILTNPLDEEIQPHRDLPDNATPLPASSLANGETVPMPGWSSLKFHRRFWADGETLEICLEAAGDAVSRSLVSRDGQFLLGPTGPAWARELALEIAQEWRADLRSTAN
jgi:hypothetical protein